MRKMLIHILLAILVLFVCPAIVPAEDAAEPAAEEELWQMEQLENNNPPSPGQRPRGENRPGSRPGGGFPGAPGGMTPGGFGFGGEFPGMPGVREPGSGRQQWQRYCDQQLSPEYLEQLQNFLTEHEPSLAALLLELRENDPERFGRSIGTVVRHYGPIMEQMQHDPEMAQLSLRKTRLTLEVEQALRAAQECRDSDADCAAQIELLRVRVAELYGLIIEQQQFEVTRAAERLEGMRQWHSLLEERLPPEDAEENPRHGMPGGGFGGMRPGGFPGGMGGRHEENWGQRRYEEMERRIDQRRRQLETWAENSESIIESRMEQLITGGDPFPW